MGSCGWKVGGWAEVSRAFSEQSLFPRTSIHVVRPNAGIADGTCTACRRALHRHHVPRFERFADGRPSARADDGWELLRRAELPGSVFAVAMSGYGRDSDLERSRTVGFRHHLIKPMALDQLEDVLAQAVEELGRP
jgi:hypothetical protein